MVEQGKEVITLGEGFFMVENKFVSTVKSALSAPMAAENPIYDNRLAAGRPWFPWGLDNLFPVNTLNLVNKNPVARRALEFLSSVHYGRGVYAYRVLDYDNEGNEIRQPLGGKRMQTGDEQVMEWMRVNKIDLQMAQVISDYEWFYNFFPEMILSIDKKTIVNMNVLKAAWFRWGLMDPKTRKISNAYISRNWANRGIEPDPLNVFDPENPTAHDKFVLPCTVPSSFDDYYNLAPWDSARAWTEISNSVPDIKKAIFKNQIAIKYHIKVPKTYWPEAYKNWEDMTQDQRIQTKIGKIKEFNDMLTGTNSVGKTFFTEFDVDPNTGKAFAGWEIIPVDDKLKEGAYLPDEQGANTEILFAMGMPGALLGASSPGGKLSGSGSDIIQSYNIVTASKSKCRDITVQPLNFVRDFNKWDSSIKFGYREIRIANATATKATLATDTTTLNSNVE